MPPKLTECFWCSDCEAWGDSSPCEECYEETEECCFYCGINIENCDCENGIAEAGAVA